MLLLDIKPIQNPTYDCLQELILSVSEHLNREHVLMNLGYWGFEYKQTPEVGSLLGSKISVGKTITYLEYLNKYHGIQLNYKNLSDFNVFIYSVNEELKSGRPLILQMDSFYCPWNLGFKKHHFVHSCLIIGYNEQKNELICIDPYWSYEIYNLTINRDFMIYDRYATFILHDIPKSKIDLIELITDITTYINGNTESENIFLSIRKFADDVRSLLDITFETKGFDNTAAVPIFRRLKEIECSRINFSKAMNFVSSNYGLCTIDEISKDMELSGKLWSNIRLILIKGSMNPDINMNYGMIADRIWDIAKLEENVANKLLGCLNLLNN